MPSPWVDSDLSSQLRAFCSSERLSSSTLRLVRRRSVEINVYRLLEALIREQFLSSSNRKPLARIYFRPYVVATPSCFTRYEIRWTSDDQGKFVADLSIGSVTRWLHDVLGAYLTLEQWDTVQACFRQSLAHTMVNLLLSSTQPCDTRSSIERNPEGHNLYPFPTFRRGIKLTQLCGRHVEIPLFVANNFVYNSIALPQWANCNTQAFGVPRSWENAPLIPIHPWQLECSNAVRRAIGVDIQRSGLFLTAESLTSLRTFSLISGYHLKLAADVVITSARRLIFQMHCQNAVAISNLVTRLQSIGQLPKSFSAQHDVATFSIADMELAPHVSGILRTPIPNETNGILPAVDLWYGPAAAVTLWSNLTDAELQDCWYKYCLMLIEGPVKLLLHHGIAIEPHLQNVYVKFRNWVPDKIIVRDLDHSILDRVTVEPVLKELGLRLFPHTWQYMPEFEAGINRLVHDLFHAHISEAILAIAGAGRLSVGWLYQIVLDVLEAQRPPPQDLIASHRFQRLQQSLETVRALLRMRLEGKEEAIYL